MSQLFIKWYKEGKLFDCLCIIIYMYTFIQYTLYIYILKYCQFNLKQGESLVNHNVGTYTYIVGMPYVYHESSYVKKIPFHLLRKQKIQLVEFIIIYNNPKLR